MITFDDSLSLLVDLVYDAWGVEAIAKNLFLRDALGRLTLIVLDPERTVEDRNAISCLINDRLKGYADPSGISAATPEELFDDTLREYGIGLEFPVSGAKFQGYVRVVDRRVVGSDWLRQSGGNPQLVPRLFFVSLKGGVGRSTALCVLAAHLASEGRRVLAIDMDLEAPGLGTMLLDLANQPRFGLLDYLVETNIAAVDDTFLSDMAGASQLAAGRGSITVIPALGALATGNPLNVLGKIARAYLPSAVDPVQNSFSAKVERLIERFVESGSFDVVLVDARAGLHESTAAAAIALKGETLIFGIDQPQTYAGYRALLAQQALVLGADWTDRIHLVEAKAAPEGPSDEFRLSMIDIVSNLRKQEEPLTIPVDDLRTTFEVEWDDAASVDLVYDIDVGCTHIYSSGAFLRFDPLKFPDRLTSGMYAVVYGHFLETCETIINSAYMSLEGQKVARG